jgi:hypothetical protein
MAELIMHKPKRIGILFFLLSISRSDFDCEAHAVGLEEVDRIGTWTRTLEFVKPMLLGQDLSWKLHSDLSTLKLKAKFVSSLLFAVLVQLTLQNKNTVDNYFDKLQVL